MSNLSSIGFGVSSQEEFEKLIEMAVAKSSQIGARNGSYLLYSEPSGAELWTQVNTSNEIIGANPHFSGQSKRRVCLTSTVERPESELDGAYHAWAAPITPDDPDSGEYPFVFDVPDFHTNGDIDFPRDFEIQLSAFAQELDIYENEDVYHANQSSEPQFAVRSFIPSGLFNFEEDSDPDPPQALGIFTGIIKQAERRRNSFTNSEFYWMLVETLGGEVDVVADLSLIPDEPLVGGVAQGQFWLTGRLIDPPAPIEPRTKNSFFRRLFGR